MLLLEIRQITRAQAETAVAIEAKATFEAVGKEEEEGVKSYIRVVD